MLSILVNTFSWMQLNFYDFMLQNGNAVILCKNMFGHAAQLLQLYVPKGEMPFFLTYLGMQLGFCKFKKGEMAVKM